MEFRGKPEDDESCHSREDGNPAEAEKPGYERSLIKGLL